MNMREPKKAVSNEREGSSINNDAGATSPWPAGWAAYQDPGSGKESQSEDNLPGGWKEDQDPTTGWLLLEEAA